MENDYFEEAEMYRKLLAKALEGLMFYSRHEDGGEKARAILKKMDGIDTSSNDEQV